MKKFPDLICIKIFVRLRRLQTVLLPLLLLSNFIGITQTIQIRSIKNQRQAGGENGYTFDGVFMQNSRKKLLNPKNFGPLGIYPKNVVIIDAYESSGSLTEITKESKEDLFFMGSFNRLDPSFEQFTENELDSLLKWSVRGGKMIITSGLAAIGMGVYNSDFLNSRWAYQPAIASATAYPTNLGNQTDLFKGPFGSPAFVMQYGSAQGFFHKYPENVKVMAVDANGKPTVYMDCNTLDLMVVETDIYTSLGYHHPDTTIGMFPPGISYGDIINNNNDKFLANSIVFMDKLQQPPFMVKEDNVLSVENVYLNYQWYRNGEWIENNTSKLQIEPNASDSYFVEVEVNGGCKVRSNIYDPECDFFVPTAFSPDNNDMNEQACVYGSCAGNMEFRIFDRWGELVFTSSETQRCWDGTYKGAKAPDGVYGWSLQGSRKSGSKINKSGNITLIR